ncbi:hypothetical protein TNCV_4374211 [Trichonephila clavipes]|uniref:Uncharacterized protein n=1 Tax=Trichonephila clavipes TaxID=2585209 RepID=A0A8X6R3X2_TRICX|nr:hypothetical protein TNCV_4374211 [Trichonephila clavipes]
MDKPTSKLNISEILVELLYRDKEIDELMIPTCLKVATVRNEINGLEECEIEPYDSHVVKRHDLAAAKIPQIMFLFIITSKGYNDRNHQRLQQWRPKEFVSIYGETPAIVYGLPALTAPQWVKEHWQSSQRITFSDHRFDRRVQGKGVHKNPSHRITHMCYGNIIANQVHLYMATVSPVADGLYQQDKERNVIRQQVIQEAFKPCLGHRIHLTGF